MQINDFFCKDDIWIVCPYQMSGMESYQETVEQLLEEACFMFCAMHSTGAPAYILEQTVAIREDVEVGLNSKGRAKIKDLSDAMRLNSEEIKTYFGPIGGKLGEEDF